MKPNLQYSCHGDHVYWFTKLLSKIFWCSHSFFRKSKEKIICKAYTVGYSKYHSRLILLKYFCVWQTNQCRIWVWLLRWRSQFKGLQWWGMWAQNTPCRLISYIFVLEYSMHLHPVTSLIMSNKLWETLKIMSVLL